jgi:hypothetical protein
VVEELGIVQGVINSVTSTVNDSCGIKSVALGQLNDFISVLATGKRFHFLANLRPISVNCTDITR